VQISPGLENKVRWPKGVVEQVIGPLVKLRILNEW
jgi:hypothetical protein